MMDYTTSATQDVPKSEPTPSRYGLLWLGLYHATRLVIAIIFIWSGLTKISDPRGFAVVIDAYGLMPETWVMPVAFGLPVLELMAGIGLLMHVTGSLHLTSGLMLLFMAILAYGIALGLDVDCGCFGTEDPEAKAFHGLRTALFRDILIMAGVIYLYIWRYRWGAKPARLLNLLQSETERRNR